MTCNVQCQIVVSRQRSWLVFHMLLVKPSVTEARGRKHLELLYQNRIIGESLGLRLSDRFVTAAPKWERENKHFGFANLGLKIFGPVCPAIF